MTRARQFAACLTDVQERPRDVEGDRARVAAGIAGPHRRPMHVDQADAGHLPLFIAGNEATLF